MVLVVVLSLASALLNATSSILQKQGSKRTPTDESLKASLVADLLRRPSYLAGIGALIAAFVLQAGALSQGQLSTVQPVLAAELLFLMGILAVWSRRHVGRREWAGAAAIAVGVGGFLAVASPSGGSGSAGPLGWALTGAAVVAVLAVLLSVGHAARGSRRAALFGAAGAVAFAVTAALVKVSVAVLAHQGVAALFGSWRPYAMAVAGAGAVFFSGNAFQRGSVAAAQAALSSVDPLVSIGIGVGLFGEHLRASPVDLAVEAVALLVMLAGIVVLSQSPLITGVNADDRNANADDPNAGTPRPDPELRNEGVPVRRGAQPARRAAT